MYGKLQNGLLIEAPKDYILQDGTVIYNFNRSIEKMIMYGFKPIIQTTPAYNVDTQYAIFTGYNDAGKYIRYCYEIQDIEPSEAEVEIIETELAMQFLDINFEEQVQTLSDEQALQVKSVFPEWKEGVEYVVGFKLMYLDVLYKVLQSHTSQTNWTPDVSPSLFAQVIVGQNGEILEWVQPDSTNPYMTGDKVMFEGKVYESVIDNNVWSPAAYPAGWQQVEV